MSTGKLGPRELVECGSTQFGTRPISCAAGDPAVATVSNELATSGRALIAASTVAFLSATRAEAGDQCWPNLRSSDEVSEEKHTAQRFRDQSEGTPEVLGKLGFYLGS